MSAPVTPPARGEVWHADFNPVRGHEQAGTRPALVLSVDLFNQGPAGLVVVLPITSKNKRIPWHVFVAPPEGGLSVPSYIKCEDIRSLAAERLVRRYGRVAPETLDAVTERLRTLLDL